MWDITALTVRGSKSACAAAGADERVRGKNSLRFVCGLLGACLTFINQWHSSAQLSAYRSLQSLWGGPLISVKGGFGHPWPFLLTRARIRLNKSSFISWRVHIPPYSVTLSLRRMECRPFQDQPYLQILWDIFRCNTRPLTFSPAATTNVVLVGFVAQTATVPFCWVLGQQLGPRGGGQLDFSSFPWKPICHE